jgi:DnaK suppressor protein
MGSERYGRYSELREALLERREEIQRRLQNGLHCSINNAPVRESDLVDEFREKSEVDTQIFLLERKSTEFQAIDAALQRLEDGTFGSCRECGQEISDRRLTAVPEAVLCKECSDRRHAPAQRENHVSAAERLRYSI